MPVGAVDAAHQIKTRHADFVECECGQLCVNDADHREHVRHKQSMAARGIDR